MWLLFHHNAKTRPVRDGHAFVETCPECGQRATFVEVEITENIGVFFVDLVGDKERAYRCGACGETFDLKDQAANASAKPVAAAPAPPPRSMAQLERERAADEARRRAAAQAKAEAAHAAAVRIDDELAELKKRMGR
jgi:hypothetical protein